MSPFPWKFHSSLHGQVHVIADAQGRILASNVPVEDGPAMAAAPLLVEFLEAIAKRSDLLGVRARDELKLLGLSTDS